MASFLVRATKRAIDVAGSTAGLAMTLPLYPAIALAIFLEDPGPVFYTQRRAGTLRERGKRGQLSFDVFDMFKFRTMRTDAEKLTGAVIAGENDPRILRVGRLLRRTRLDELPQLWNVLRGQMSIVGPRPERPELLLRLAAAIPFFEERMRDVKPGITGLAQISLGYTGKPMEESEIGRLAKDLINPFGLDEADGALADDMRIKLLFDLAYSATLEDLHTFLPTELSVIWRTPMAMFAGTGR